MRGQDSTWSKFYRQISEFLQLKGIDINTIVERRFLQVCFLQVSSVRCYTNFRRVTEWANYQNRCGFVSMLSKNLYVIGFFLCVWDS